MSKIKLICDTISDLPKGIIEKYDIEVIPTMVIFEGKEYRAGVDISGDDFYKMLRASESMPSTSQITYITYKEVFERYTSQGQTVLYLVGSSAASGTHQSARMAANEIEGDIRIVDTFSLSIGGGILVQEAARMIEEGKDIDYIIENIEGKKKNIEVFFSVNSLEYLHKGGRISGAKATIGSILNIIPILNIEDGLVKQKTQVRGMNKVATALITQLKSRVGEYFSDKEIYVGCGDDKKQLDKLIAKVEEELSPKSIRTFEIGPCVGCHSGPSVLGIACLK